MIHTKRCKARRILSIVTVFFAVLLSGSSSLTFHANVVIGGGPTSGSQANAAPGP